MVALGELLVLPVAIFTTASADPRLLGALRKTVSPGGGMKELMTHFSTFHSISNHAHGKHSRNCISFAVRFFFWSHARDCTTFTLYDLTDFLRREGDSARI